MKKQSFFLSFAISAMTAVIFLTSCGSDPETYDESSHLGTYYGNHYLADSNNIRLLLGNPTATMVYADTLDITNGASSTDGLLNVKSRFLNGSTIEINIANNNVTPILLGDIEVLGTTLKDTKITSGTGIWNADRSRLDTHLIATATFNYNGTDVPLPGLNITGIFNK